MSTRLRSFWLLLCCFSSDAYGGMLSYELLNVDAPSAVAATSLLSSVADASAVRCARRCRESWECEWFAMAEGSCRLYGQTEFASALFSGPQGRIFRAATSSGAEDWCPLNDGLSWLGLVIQADITGLSQAECQAKCEAEPGCAGYVFGGINCDLKATTAGFGGYLMPTIWSTVVKCPGHCVLAAGTDYPEGDIYLATLIAFGYAYSVPDGAACAGFCRIRRDCRVATFNTANKQCRLKTHDPGALPAGQADSNIIAYLPRSCPDHLL